MKRKYKILLFLIEAISIYIVLFSKLEIPCLIKKHLHIYCPACGLTRAFKSILSLNIINALNYNIFSILVFFILIIGNIYLITDIIFNTKKTDDFMNNLGKHYKLILLLLTINTIINNIKY